jgi:hypothetical protein
MTDLLTNPGDVLEGSGQLLEHGRLIANVDYHLTIPRQIHFFINPPGNLRLNYENHIGGFILLIPQDAKTLSLTEYTLELANKSKRTIRVERRYRNVEYKGEPRVSFWVRMIGSH